MMKAEQLQAEKADKQKRLAFDFDSPMDGWAVAYAERIKQIDRELARIARRRAYSREHRQVLYDLNGHHGPA